MASLLLVGMPFAPSSFLLLVVCFFLWVGPLVRSKTFVDSRSAASLVETAAKTKSKV